MQSLKFAHIVQERTGATVYNFYIDIRTPSAIGINRNGRFTYLVVVDGRQPFYSKGATFAELADLLKELGVFYAMSLDGGGSSTMVVEGEDVNRSS